MQHVLKEHCHKPKRAFQDQQATYPCAVTAVAAIFGCGYRRVASTVAAAGAASQAKAATAAAIAATAASAAPDQKRLLHRPRLYCRQRRR